MSTNLESIWTGAGDARLPKSQTDIEVVFDAMRAELGTEIANLLAEPAATRPALANAMIKQLAGCVIEVNKEFGAAIALENNRRTKNPGNLDDFVRLRRQLDKLNEELSLWRMIAANAVSAGSDNARAHFADAGQWAIHFSTVRMTLSTFFIGLSWGVVSLKWKEFSLPLLYGSVAIWTITGLFLWLFTWQTSKYSKRQKKAKALLPTLAYRPNADPKMGVKTWLGIWSPFIIYLGVSVGYGFLLKAWQAEGKNSSAVAAGNQCCAVAGPYEGTATIDKVEVKFWAKDFADFEAKVREIRAHLTPTDIIGTGVRNENATSTLPTPNQTPPSPNP